MDCVVLEEEIDPDYEPTDAEIDEYAQWLGMKADEKSLRWIAREGLKVRASCPSSIASSERTFDTLSSFRRDAGSFTETLESM